MKIITFTFLILLTLNGKAQKAELNDTIFFNAQWEICEKPVASYYRLGKLVIDNYAFFTGEVKDYYLDGKLQMQGTYDKEGLKQGTFTYYYPNGEIERQGSFEHNDLKGIWNYYTKDGKLTLSLNCESGNAFTPLLVINSKRDTIVNKGNGNFIIDMNEYPGIFYSNLRVRFIEGACSKGLRDGSWKYYELPNIYSISTGLQVPQRKLVVEEKYKSGKIRSDFYNPCITIFPKKDENIDKFKGDYAFGDDKESQIKLAQFLFQKVSPEIKSVSSSIKNNIVDYVSCIAKAMNLFRDKEMFCYYPLKEFDGNAFVLCGNVVTLETGDTVPADMHASIQFRLMPKGFIKDIEIKGGIAPVVSAAIQYYLSKLRNVSPCKDATSCSLNLQLDVENEAGSFEGIKAYATNTIIKYAGTDSSCKRILVRKGSFIVEKESNFPGNTVQWQMYLNKAIQNELFLCARRG